MNPVADTFKVFVPFELVKGGGVDKKGKKVPMKFKGIASNAKTGKDMDGETLDVNGFDYAPLLKSGHINWNHQANKDPMAIVGEPTSAKVINNEFHIEGVLYSESDLANKIYKAAEIMEKSGSTRRFGFSIEGIATQRDPKDKKRVTKASIMNVAICPTPKNAGTSMQLVKGMEFDMIKSDEFTDELIMDTINGSERVIIDKAFNIAIIGAKDKIIDNNTFEKSVVAIHEAMLQGTITGNIDEIKSHIASFKQALNCTVWVGGCPQ